MWTVTRQRQWPDGDAVVEVSAGGIDYTNPDALAGRYPGEFEEFGDPRAAIDAAIDIAESWQRDAPDEEVQIATGGTGGFTMPFEGEEPTDKVKAKLREWADGVWEGLPGCDQCGDKIAGDPVTLRDYGDDWKFCSESCAERWYEEQQEAFEGDEEGVEDDDDAVEDEDEGPGEAGGGAPRASGAYHRVVRALGAAPRRAAAPDATVENLGSVCILQPLSPAGAAWVKENVAAEPWQTIGGGIAVEPRMVQGIIDGMTDAGLTVSD